MEPNESLAKCTGTLSNPCEFMSGDYVQYRSAELLRSLGPVLAAQTEFIQADIQCRNCINRILVSIPTDTPLPPQNADQK